MSTEALSPRAPLAVDAALLPDDAAVLKELVAQLMQEILSLAGKNLTSMAAWRLPLVAGLLVRRL
jgi:hypothetical protein